MAGHAGIASRIEALSAELVKLEMDDGVQARRFVVDGFQSLALKADSDAVRLRAYEVIAKLHWVSLFQAQPDDDRRGRRSEEDVKALLEQRLSRLLPKPDD